MRISIVMGFFLPVPPVRGGATEKSWHRLAKAFAAEGHAITLISRRWQDWPDDERREGVRHLRIGGFNHRRGLAANLLLDLRWSFRARRAMPAADIAVIHAVTLPALGLRGTIDTGKIVVMPGRMPKGQYRFYRNVSRVLATSNVVRDRVVRENPALAPVTKVTGYPIEWEELSGHRGLRTREATRNIVYAGRLHREKGLDLLVEAACRLISLPLLPPWRLVLCGPADVASGGGGESYVAGLRAKLSARLPAERWRIEPPRFENGRLAELYREADIFCYPSVAATGETFGVAIAEAMAAGAMPLVSGLACFRDLVSHGTNGMVFSHEGNDPAGSLVSSLAEALGCPAETSRTMSLRATESVRHLDFPRYARDLLADFATIGGGQARMESRS